jgi:CxxC motif-containing protein
MPKKLICIQCPLGCELSVLRIDKNISVAGNRCEKGVRYAQEEILDPKRTVTAVVLTNSDKLPRLPVKTSAAVKVELIAEVLKKIYSFSVVAPIKTGEILHQDIDGCGTNLLATRTLEMTSG